MTKPPIS